MKYDHLQGLKGLRVMEMKKFQPMLQNMKQEIIIYNQAMQESIQVESKDELVVNKLQAQDHIFVDIDSQDLWLKVFLNMNSKEDDKSFESEFEIKIDQQLTGKELKTVLQKLTISIWNRLCDENQKEYEIN